MCLTFSLEFCAILSFSLPAGVSGRIASWPSQGFLLNSFLGVPLFLSAVFLTDASRERSKATFLAESIAFRAEFINAVAINVLARGVFGVEGTLGTLGTLGGTLVPGKSWRIHLKYNGH